jgi:hypothetical protein
MRLSIGGWLEEEFDLEIRRRGAGKGSRPINGTHRENHVALTLYSAQ